MPGHGGGGDQHHDDAADEAGEDMVATAGGRVGVVVDGGHAALVAQRPAAGVQEVDESEQHGDGGGAKAPMPAPVLAEITGDQPAEDRADIDAHVEEGEAGVAAADVVLVVELADEGRDVGLEQPGADGDRDEAEEEDRGGGTGYCEQGVPEHDGDAADDDRPLAAPETVGDPAAGQGQYVGRGGVQAVDCRCVGRRQAEAAILHLVDKKEDQDRPHAVVAEAFPHFDEEEGNEARRILHGRRH